MGLGGVGGWQLIILLLVVLLLFGSKRLRSAGSDLGAAFRSFRQGVDEVEGIDASAEPKTISQQTVKKPKTPS
jgi:sec-independent protein translocase protein TatA